MKEIFYGIIGVINLIVSEKTTSVRETAAYINYDTK